MPTKPKTQQPQGGLQKRDQFETPAYATRLLLPYIPESVHTIWEPACGSGRIARVLEFRYGVVKSDLLHGPEYDFFTYQPGFGFDAVVTNPPFSGKKKFFDRCLSYGVPFALLIPADYSGWVIQAMKVGCEKIVPERRIDYYTPDTVELVWKGQTLDAANKNSPNPCKKSEVPEGLWTAWAEEPWAPARYPSVDAIPTALIAKYSAAQFHSLWLTWGFKMGRTETFVPLSNETKRRG